MPNEDFNQQIRDAIESFVEELSALVRTAALQSVTEVFGSGGSGGRRGRGAAGRISSRRAKGEMRSPQALAQLVGKLLSEVKTTPGQRMEQIAKSLGSTTKDLALPAKKLI